MMRYAEVGDRNQKKRLAIFHKRSAEFIRSFAFRDWRGGIYMIDVQNPDSCTTHQKPEIHPYVIDVCNIDSNGNKKSHERNSTKMRKSSLCKVCVLPRVATFF